MPIGMLGYIVYCMFLSLLGRPTYLSADLGVLLGFFFFLSLLLSFLPSFFFRQLPSKLAERNLTKIGHMFGSKCDLKCMSKIWGITYPKIGCPKTTFFRRLRNLTATLTAYISGMKHDIHDRASMLTTTTSSQKCHELWSTNGFKLDRHFYPPYVNSAFYFIERLRRRRSANKTQPNFAKR